MARTQPVICRLQTSGHRHAALGHACWRPQWRRKPSSQSRFQHTSVRRLAIVGLSLAVSNRDRYACLRIQPSTVGLGLLIDGHLAVRIVLLAPQIECSPSLLANFVPGYFHGLALLIRDRQAILI